MAAVRQAGKYGRRPNDPAKPRLRFADYARFSASSPPTGVDWYSEVSTWGMLLNDTLGDCVIAEFGHQIESSSRYAEQSEIVVMDADVLTLYEKAGGYVPGDPSTDNGCVIQDALGVWRSDGLGGRKCLAFAELDVKNLSHVMSAVADFGSVDIGISVYAGDETAFNNGDAWSTIYPAGQLLGGHSVEVVGYDSSGGWCVTWGAVQRFSWAWWSARVSEAWVVVLPEWLSALGRSPGSLDLYQLGQDMAALTGDPNPFPPNPPSPADPNVTLWEGTAKAWCQGVRTRPDLVALKAALETWAASQGLS